MQKKKVTMCIKKKPNASKHEKKIVTSNMKDSSDECEKKLLEKKAGLELELRPLFILVLCFF